MVVTRDYCVLQTSTTNRPSTILVVVTFKSCTVISNGEYGVRYPEAIKHTTNVSAYGNITSLKASIVFRVEMDEISDYVVNRSYRNEMCKCGPLAYAG